MRAAEKDNLGSLIFHVVFFFNKFNLCSSFGCRFLDSELFCEQDGFSSGVDIVDVFESEVVDKETFE